MQKFFYICKEKYLKDKSYYKVRDHYLFKGEYRGAALRRIL